MKGDDNVDRVGVGLGLGESNVGAGARPNGRDSN